uniref:Uncharacterized protein n=1 Tax=Sodiomyces alkalinus fusarivirus 1 TaxID=1917080 RepID=A0A2D1VMI1_9VIRU|nr:hypothetical protein [Sodiomyces alkalinus fusarivirus 1]
MSDKTKKQTVSAEPAGPAQSPSIKSTLSASAEVSERVKDFLKSFSRPGTISGTPIRMVDTSKMDELSEALTSLIHDSVSHSVAPSELAKLNAELATLRLKVSTFETDKERALFAAEASKKELVDLKNAWEVQKAANAESRAAIDKQMDDLRAALVEARAQNLEAKKAVMQSKKESADSKPDSTLKEASEQAANRVTDLNNQLQQANKEKAELASKASAFENKIIELSNELSIAQAKGDLDSPFTFANVLKAPKLGYVGLKGTVSDMLGAKSRAFVEKARNADPLDVKLRAKYLRIALKESKAAAVKGFATFFDGVYDDIRISTYQSRKLFTPVVNSVLDTLSGRSGDLSEAELSLIMQSLDTAQIRMVKSVREKGFLTLKDVIDAGLTADALQVSDFEDTESVAAGKLVKDHRKATKDAERQALDKEINLIRARAEKKPESDSWYKRAKRGFKNFGNWFKTRTSSVRAHLEEKWTLTTSQKLARKGWWGKILAAPLTFLHYATFGMV